MSPTFFLKQALHSALSRLSGLVLQPRLLVTALLQLLHTEGGVKSIQQQQNRADHIHIYSHYKTSTCIHIYNIQIDRSEFCSECLYEGVRLSHCKLLIRSKLCSRSLDFSFCYRLFSSLFYQCSCGIFNTPGVQGKTSETKDSNSTFYFVKKRNACHAMYFFFFFY